MWLVGDLLVGYIERGMMYFSSKFKSVFNSMQLLTYGNFNKSKNERRERMNKYVAWSAFIVLLITAASNVYADDRSSKSLEKINLSGPIDWWPFSEQNGSVVDGISLEVAEAIFGPMNVTVEHSYVAPWGDVQYRIMTGEIDGAWFAYKNDTRLNYSVYSQPYTMDPVVLFGKKKFVYKSTADLLGKRIVVMSDNSYGQELDDFFNQENNLTLIKVKDPKEAFKVLGSGNADWFIYSYWSGIKVMASEGMYFENSTPAATPLAYIQISKKSPWASVANMEKIDKGVRWVNDTGFVGNLLRKAIAGIT